MFNLERMWLSRDEWRERGRVVTAPNEEARDVRNFYLPHVRGARHVFAENQTLPLEQSVPAAA